MAFSVIVLIDAINVTGLIEGSVFVSGNEAEARIARFTINPAVGSIDPYQYIGKLVTVDFINGATERLFTGIVHLPSYDITTGVLSFTCTDNLQEAVELIDRTAVDTLLPGSWDDSVFSDPEENWTYSQQIMSTYPGSFNKDVNGSIIVTDWEPKAVADYTFIDSTIFHDSLSISLAERRSITNSVKISFQNRYQRLWQREISGVWALGFTFGTWLLNTTDLPTKDMVQQAASGWTIKNITYVDLPASGLINGVIWDLSPYAQTLCQGATIDVARRWKQNVTDNYAITVASAASIAQHGLLEVEQKHAFTANEPTEFEDFADYQAPTGTLVEAGNYVEITESSTSNAITTAMNVAKTKILGSHRNNLVTFKVPLNAALDTDKTVQVNHTKVQAKGKVSSVSHEINLLTGSAMTTCIISVYQPNITLQTDDTLNVPPTPYSDPSGLTNSLPTLETHLGNIDGAVVDDPTWNGFVGNYDSWTGTLPAPESYQERFSFDIPEISDTVAIEHAAITSYNIAIPENQLVIIK